MKKHKEYIQENSELPQSDGKIAGDRKTLLADTLRQRIMSMELAPGAVVDEVTLSAEFGLSRPPVRELMRQLAAEGYIELEANRPARVSAMNYHSLRSFFLAAPLIYTATSQLAATHATPDDVARLKEIQERFRAAMDQNDAWGRVFYNDQFHYEIGLIARNDYLLPSLRRLQIDHARIAKTFYRAQPSDDMQQDMNEAVHQHDLIIDAIACHDVAAIDELIRAHWELSRRRLADYVMPEGVVIPLSF
ncbi:GntR family transcriptional regulator [Superficieibacter electus]|uniref:GntR family transcriptional regulator n=1 Tax=Superficieibacter electus TaxID=2022662 RepID=A0A2P5GVT9_9ENTR|nr:GntR family transcriptional regulator [Superficieibacter electus]POP47659.1 GntR family transcriptional regulator [Superficieibacter electus]POP50670.1 GntR family transcriptional regulator [Superficieibacter electus]